MGIGDVSELTPFEIRGRQSFKAWGFFFDGLLAHLYMRRLNLPASVLSEAVKN